MAEKQRTLSEPETRRATDASDGIASGISEAKAQPAGRRSHGVSVLAGRGQSQSRQQVWSTDITYVRMAHGFVYLVAVMDWFSRYVLSWAVSTTLELTFCVEALQSALRQGRPEIFNSDQGAQFTSDRFTGELTARRIAVSMDGRGRCLDNIFIERLWRSLKYEEIYLKDYSSVPEARAGIASWFRFYNRQRLHQSLSYRTPAALYENRA